MPFLIAILFLTLILMFHVAIATLLRFDCRLFSSLSPLSMIDAATCCRLLFDAAAAFAAGLLFLTLFFFSLLP